MNTHALILLAAAAVIVAIAVLVDTANARRYRNLRYRNLRNRNLRYRRLIRHLENRVSTLEADLAHAEADRNHISAELDEVYRVAAGMAIELRRPATAWDRAEAESLIEDIEADLADPSSDTGAKPTWRAGWDAALHTYGEPAIEVLRGAMAEIDRLAVEVRAVTADREAIATRAAELERTAPRETSASIATWQNETFGPDGHGQHIEAPCTRLDEFHDRELTDAASASFRDHLAGCERCQDVLHGRMQEQIAVSRRAP